RRPVNESPRSHRRHRGGEGEGPQRRRYREIKKHRGREKAALRSIRILVSLSLRLCVSVVLWQIHCHLISKLHWLRYTEGRRTSLISQSTRASSLSATLKTLR